MDRHGVWLLIGGLVGVLTSLWGNARQATRRLTQIQEELSQVQRTAETLLDQKPGNTSGFYADLARGASPTILLANLKGQIDHLAGSVRAKSGGS